MFALVSPAPIASAAIACADTPHAPSQPCTHEDCSHPSPSRSRPVPYLQATRRTAPIACVRSICNFHRHNCQRTQQIVEFMLIANVGTNLFANLRDGHADQACPPRPARSSGHDAAHVDGARATLLQRSIVKKRIGIRIQNLMRELRRCRRINGEASYTAHRVCRPSRPSGQQGPSPRPAHPSSLRESKDDPGSECRPQCSQSRPPPAGKRWPADHPSACAESAAGSLSFLKP